MSHISRPVKVTQSQGRSDARRERWKGHRRARRAEFVEAAIRAIGNYGAEVGMGDIAAEAGVSKPVLYRHFSDKSDLYLAVGEWGTNLLMERIKPALEQGGTIRERIERIVSTYLGVIEEYPELYRFVVRRNFADRPVQTDPVSNEKTIIANSLSRLLGEYLRSLELDSGGVEAWSHGLVGMVQASGDWWMERHSMSRDDLTEYLTKIIWFALDGVLRSGGIVIDPDEPLELPPDLKLVEDEDV
ncbi:MULTISPECIES: TetR/AcrR family transcriptional regulator [Actinopolyspora]|uniref:DNA-binding transcriptional regulator, AcrR family n=1 Tax=Actinopolyspora saharensis TaxID=995062 RepID=A0A1H1H2Q0_9ACTN|nr:TetR family transcriptional regulator [Actinopolyspora saharensis]NHD17967.1 TetR/AcrR family transcriptional regulator [Actinopolyspora sp. BKK2]NHE77840.1 TetR/AcrR family transcriptional regulator [Actinopolyspora sp. BKK1]SDR19633.1 DNA-binding transcriptional regulator, AcrR family [Actinopolyspora saharensis]